MGILSLLFACKKTDSLKNSGFTKYTVNSGDHNSTPFYFKGYVGECNINASAYFTENSVYNLNSVDQLDWNKLDGFKLDYNGVPNHAAMVAWRYNVIDSIFEIAPYFNNNGLVLPDTNEIIKVKPYEIFYYNVSLNGKNSSISITHKLVTITKSRVLRNAFAFTRVSAWFGGNMTAPNKVELFIKR